MWLPCGPGQPQSLDPQTPSKDLAQACFLTCWGITWKPQHFHARIQIESCFLNLHEKSAGNIKSNKCSHLTDSTYKLQEDIRTNEYRTTPLGQIFAIILKPPRPARGSPPGNSCLTLVPSGFGLMGKEYGFRV